MDVRKLFESPTVDINHVDKEHPNGGGTDLPDILLGLLTQQENKGDDKMTKDKEKAHQIPALGVAQYVELGLLSNLGIPIKEKLAE